MVDCCRRNRKLDNNDQGDGFSRGGGTGGDLMGSHGLGKTCR